MTNRRKWALGLLAGAGVATAQQLDTKGFDPAQDQNNLWKKSKPKNGECPVCQTKAPVILAGATYSVFGHAWGQRPDNTMHIVSCGYCNNLFTQLAEEPFHTLKASR